MTSSAFLKLLPFKCLLGESVLIPCEDRSSSSAERPSALEDSVLEVSAQVTHMVAIPSHLRLLSAPASSIARHDHDLIR